MGFFGIGSKKNDTSQPTVDTAKASEAAESILNSDLRVNSGGIDMSNREVRAAILNEVRRQRSQEHILSNAQLSRLKDSLLLYTTKLENIEENLQKCREHQEWVRRYVETETELEHQRKRQFEVNKQVAVMAREEQELERYESFETIQSVYQRLQLLEQQRRQNNEEQTLLTREADELQKQLAEQQRRLNQLTEQRKEAERQHSQSHDTIEQAQYLEVTLDLLGQRSKHLENRLSELVNQQRVVEKEIKEREKTVEAITNKLNDNRNLAQNMQNHQRMVEHGQTIVGKIEYLHKLGQRHEKLGIEVKEALRKQTERNDRMGQVYEQYRDIENKIAQLTSELKMHRYNNHGLDSYTLQKRAMSLRSSRLMMMSAQSLWNRIVMGYTMIDELTTQQSKVRLDLDGLNKNVEEMQAIVDALRRQTKAKEYSYSLSKSQNVIQLRADLKEGVQCTVCGATHHPFHSDTMLDQNKLISEIKSDFEQLDNELRHKERYLQELLLQQSAKNSEKDCFSSMLHSLRLRQNEDIKEWAIYSKLDPSFSDCSPSTNLEARTSMLRQLVENIGRDVDEAQKKLDDFNYNQTRINELNEEISHLEQTKDELVVRLNELNTGCQVVAGQVERLQQQHEDTYTRYTKLHSELDKVITIPDWENDLQRGYEAAIVHVQQVISQVTTAHSHVIEGEHQLQIARLMLEKTTESAAYLQAEIQTTLSEKSDCQRREEDTRQSLHRLIPDTTPKAFYESVNQAFSIAHQEEEIQQRRVQALYVEYSQVKARLTEVAEQRLQLDQAHAAERSRLDEWVREFNLNHPPVQYTELEHVFDENKDWNADRKRIRETRMQAQLLQDKVEGLRSSLVGLQAEGYRIPTKEENPQEALSVQISTLEKQRRDTMMQVAALQHTLDMHTKSIEEQKKAEEDGLTL